MAAWRHWRIYITANGGDAGYTSIQELELRGSIGGPDLTTPATPSNQSSFYVGGGSDPNHTAAKAIDNVFVATTNANLWINATGAALPHWLWFDLGSPVSVAELAIWPENNSNAQPRGPKNFLIQGSNDAVTWSTEVTQTGVTGWSVGTPKTFAIGSGSGVDTPIAPGAGSLSVSGGAPMVTQSANRALQAGACSLTFTGYGPLVAQSANAQLLPGAGAITFAGYAPGITTTVNVGVVPETGTLAFTGYAPSISQSLNRSASPGAGALSFAGYAPQIVQSVDLALLLAPGALTFAGHVPTVRQAAPIDSGLKGTIIEALSEMGFTVELSSLLHDLAAVHGLVAGAPLVVTPTRRSAGGLTQSISESGDTVVLERTA